MFDPGEIERAVLRSWVECEMDAPEIAEALDMHEPAVREILSMHGWDE